MQARNILPLLRPRSVAVFGASPNSSIGQALIRSLAKLGFDGEVWPVNPKYDTLEGLPCFAALEDLPGAPDLVAVCQGERLPAGPRLSVITASGGYAELILDSTETGELSRCRRLPPSHAGGPRRPGAALRLTYRDQRHIRGAGA